MALLRPQAARLPHARRKRRGGRLIGAIYARYSSRDQHSIEDQVRDCLEWAAANDVDVPEMFIFCDRAVTGRSSRRNGLKALHSAIEAGRVSQLRTHWYARRGLAVPDGRQRRKELEVKQLEPPDYVAFGEAAWRLASEGRSNCEIARKLRTTDTTIVQAIESYCRRLGLSVLTVRQRREAKLERACELLAKGLLMKDVAKQVGYSARGLKLALDEYVKSRGHALVDGRTRRGNARSGERALRHELLIAGPESETDSRSQPHVGRRVC